MRTILALLLIMAGCSKSTEKIVRILENEGCSDIVDNGADIIFDGCSDKDYFNNQFTCIKNNHQVSGVVCSGFFKGFTIRYY